MVLSRKFALEVLSVLVLVAAFSTVDAGSSNRHHVHTRRKDLARHHLGAYEFSRNEIFGEP
jgi:type II secretory pathway component PulK